MLFTDHAILAFNHEFSSYQITQRLLDEKINACIHVDHNASSYIYEHGHLIAFCVVKTYQGTTYMPSYEGTAFISLFYVMPTFRRHGIGTSMFTHALETLKIQGYRRFLLGQDMDNFFAGVPETMHTLPLITFLNRLSFVNTGHAYDLFTTERLAVRKPCVYSFGRLSKQHQNQFLTFLSLHFSPRWLEEAKTTFNKGGSADTFFVIMDTERIIAFARINTLDHNEQMHNINWPHPNEYLGGIGPLGVDPQYRGLGLGEAVVVLGTNELFDSGVTRVVVDWTGLVDFYQLLGFKPLRTYHNYTKTEETL